MLISLLCKRLSLPSIKLYNNKRSRIKRMRKIISLLKLRLGPRLLPIVKYNVTTTLLTTIKMIKSNLLLSYYKDSFGEEPNKT
jgi:hypothetical protein